jgi:hypothetical protein
MNKEESGSWDLDLNPWIATEQPESPVEPGKRTVHAHDFDGAGYEGDIGEEVGEMLSQYRDGELDPERELVLDQVLQNGGLGYSSLEDFERKVSWIRNDVPVEEWDLEDEEINPEDIDLDTSEIERGGELAAILETFGTLGLEETAIVVNAAQKPDKVKEGYRNIIRYLQDGETGDFVATTAGPISADEEAALGMEYLHELVIPGEDPEEIGSKIAESENGVEVVRYNGKGDKIPNLLDRLGLESTEEIYAIGYSDSGNSDLPLMRDLNQSIGVEESAAEEAKIDATADEDYISVDLIGRIFDTLYTAEDKKEAIMDAYQEGLDYAMEHGVERFAELEPTEHADEVTGLALEIYNEAVRDAETRMISEGYEEEITN